VVRRVAVACLAFVLAGGCDSASTDAGDSPGLIVPNFQGPAGVALRIKPDSPYSLGDLTICLDRPGSVTITRVEPRNAYGGLAVDAFAVIPNPQERGEDGFTDQPKALADLGIQTNKPAIVDHPCPPATAQPDPNREPQSKSLLLQFSKANEETAGDDGLIVKYLSDGQAHTLTIDFAVILCAASDTSGHCRR